MPLRPTRFCLGLLLLWLGLGLAASFWEVLIPGWKWFGAVLAGGLLLDGLVSFFLKRLELSRELPDRFAAGVEGQVTLRLSNQSKRSFGVKLFDGIPHESDCEVMPWSGYLKKGKFLDLEYPITLSRRGEAVFEETHLLQKSVLGLWWRFFRGGERQVVRVYPNYQPVLRYALLAMAHRQEHTGIIRKNRAGLSRDFHQLRDYQMGDSLSQIDWKASSKNQSLISREFQEQLDQSVILMLDCGRRMRSEEDGLTQFDHCLNSMLLLSYVALRQGDHIGILSFGGTDRWLPPVKGERAMTTVLNHLYDYETSPYPSDFGEAAERLLRHQKRRSMVVVLTNLRGEDGDEIVEPLRRLREKHVVVLASLREGNIEKPIERPVEGFDDSLKYLAAQNYLSEREEVLRKLQASGCLTLDETAKGFPVALANQYLEVRELI